MSQRRPRLPEAERLLIKADVAAAIDRSGGLRVASTVTGLTEAHLSRCQRADHADMIPLEAAALIDRFLGQSVICAGVCAVIKHGGVHHEGMSATDIAELAKESGDAISAAANALEDATITATEAARVTRELDQLIAAASKMRRKLARHRARHA